MLADLGYYVIVELLERGAIVGAASGDCGVAAGALYCTSRALRAVFDAHDGHLLRRVAFPRDPRATRTQHAVLAADDCGDGQRSRTRAEAWLRVARAAAARCGNADAALLLGTCAHSALPLSDSVHPLVLEQVVADVSERPGLLEYNTVPWCDACVRAASAQRRYWTLRAALLGSGAAWYALATRIYQCQSYFHDFFVECMRHGARLAHAAASDMHSVIVGTHVHKVLSVYASSPAAAAAASLADIDNIVPDANVAATGDDGTGDDDDNDDDNDDIGTAECRARCWQHVAHLHLRAAVLYERDIRAARNDLAERHAHALAELARAHVENLRSARRRKLLNAVEAWRNGGARACARMLERMVRAETVLFFINDDDDDSGDGARATIAPAPDVDDDVATQLCVGEFVAKLQRLGARVSGRDDDANTAALADVQALLATLRARHYAHNRVHARDAHVRTLAHARAAWGMPMDTTTTTAAEDRDVADERDAVTASVSNVSASNIAPPYDGDASTHCLLGMVDDLLFRGRRARTTRDSSGGVPARVAFANSEREPLPRRTGGV